VVVPFTADYPEASPQHDELHTWREDRTTGVSVRLLYGGTAAARTRLATRFAGLSTADGWLVSQALRRSGRPAYREPGESGHLVLVDSAERWRLSRLLDLFGDSRHYAPAGTRFLLIAPEAGDWWRSVSAHIARAVGVPCTRTRLTLSAPSPAADELREVVALLRQSPNLIRYADSGQQIKLAGSESVETGLLEAFDEVLGDEPGIDLEAGAVAIARRLAAAHLRQTRNPNDRAALYDRLGGRLSHPGHSQEALDAYAHAVDLRRQLLHREESPVRRGELAYSLSRLGAVQCQLHRWNDARRSLQEALRMYLVLRREAYFVHDLDMARCYETLCTAFDGLGSYREALATRQYATAIFRDLVATGTIGVKPLAASLSDLAERHLARGSHGDAAFRAAEAVPLWRELDDQHAFAALLLTRGRAFWQGGRYAEAEADLHEAIALYRSLGEERIQHGVPLAEALTLLGHVRRMKDPAGALTPYADAIGLRRRLVSFDPAHRPELAAAYVTFAWACVDSGERLDEGLTAVVDACLLYHGADSEELREARALGVQLLEALGRGTEADLVRERIGSPPQITDREIFAMVLREEFGAAARALNAMAPERAIELIVLCGPMAATSLYRDGLAETLFEGARRHDPVAFTELARMIRRR
jgi:tetratricopeptide (TPR) repeat protein